MIPRKQHVEVVLRLLREFPVVGLVGARQVGKSTLASLIVARLRASRKTPSAWFDLESDADRARLAEPMLALGRCRGLVVLDEIQEQPDLFRTLRVLADRRRGVRFLVLGSASPDLLRQSAETLAGRIAYYQLPPLSMAEVGARALERLWLRGGFPRAFTARSDAASLRWRQSFVRTFVERDLPRLGIPFSPETMARFFRMLAHWHGQIWNASEFGRSFGVADTTVRGYLDALEGTFVVRKLAPWTANVAKRQVKAPRVYLSDSGLMHALADIRDADRLAAHPRVGASWEGFLIEQIARTLGAEGRECFFWRTHAGAELDLLVVRGRDRRGFEIKRTVAPAVTPSMRTVMEDLGLDSLDVVHAGEHTFPLARRIRAVAAARLIEDLRRLAR